MKDVMTTIIHIEGLQHWWVGPTYLPPQCLLPRHSQHNWIKSNCEAHLRENRGPQNRNQGVIVWGIQESSSWIWVDEVDQLSLPIANHII